MDVLNWIRSQVISMFSFNFEGFRILFSQNRDNWSVWMFNRICYLGFYLFIERNPWVTINVIMLPLSHQVKVTVGSLTGNKFNSWLKRGQRWVICLLRKSPVWASLEHRFESRRSTIRPLLRLRFHLACTSFTIAYSIWTQRAFWTALCPSFVVCRALWG